MAITVPSLRSANPALTAVTFRRPRLLSRAETMTIGGTVNKTVLALAILLIAASYTWGLGARDPYVGVWTMVGFLGGLLVGFATVARPVWAPITTPVYAAL